MAIFISLSPRFVRKAEGKRQIFATYAHTYMEKAGKKDVL